jgi:hypothetical protein
MTVDPRQERHWKLPAAPLKDYCLSAGQSRISNDVLCQLAALRCGFYSEVHFFTPGAANLIGVGPAVFLFRYYTAVRCTVSVACVA